MSMKNEKVQNEKIQNGLTGWENVKEILNYVEMEKELYAIFSHRLSNDMRIGTLYYGGTLEDYMDILLIDEFDNIERGVRVLIGDYFTVMSEVIESHLNEIEGTDWVV